MTIQISGITGRVITPDDDDYREARRIWNGAIDKYPRYIARCTSAEDVAAAPRPRRQSLSMRSYGQYCPIARASEIFAERWTPIIVRNILLGADTFNAIAAGAPGISRTLLSQRLGELERLELVHREPAPSRKNTRYLPTPAGAELWEVCLALGNWGARWLEVGPQHVDPYVVLWSMCRSFDHARLPDKRTVVRLEFPTGSTFASMQPAGHAS